MKNAAVGYARLLAMVMILLCHYFQFFGQELAWWFNVGVQIFFIVSGFLYGQKDINDPVAFIQGRCKKILIPFWLYLVGVTIYLILFDRKAISTINVIGAFSGAKPYSGVEHLWFIPYIMFCYLITPLLGSLRVRIKKQTTFVRWLGIILSVLVAEVFQRLYGFYFRPSRVFCYIIGYFYAVQLNDWSGDTKKQRLSSYTAIVIALSVNMVRVYFKYCCGSRFTGMALSAFALFEQYSHIALGFAIFVGCLELFRYAKYNVFLEFGDKYSFYIYIVHHIIINSEYSVLVYINNAFCGVLISVLLVIFSGIVLYGANSGFEKCLKHIMMKSIVNQGNNNE